MASWRIYKPNKTNNGAASQWQLSEKKDEKYDKWMFFLTVTKQTGVSDGNASFGWEQAGSVINMKLGEVDLGELLTVLNGLSGAAGKDGKGLFHKTPKGNTVLQFSKLEKDGNFYGYGLRISKKLTDDKEATMIQHMISLAEGEILRVILAEALKKILGY